MKSTRKGPHDLLVTVTEAMLWRYAARSHSDFLWDSIITFDPQIILLWFDSRCILLNINSYGGDLAHPQLDLVYKVYYIVCDIGNLYIYMFTVYMRVNSLANIFIAIIFLFISICTYPKGTTGKKATLPLILFGWSLLWFGSWSIHPVELLPVPCFGMPGEAHSDIF